MTTAVRKLPPHGTEYRYRGPKNGSWPGCRCTKCTHAQTRGGKARAVARLRGEGPLYPGTPVVEHIKKLHDEHGMSYALIARRAGVSDATITYLVRGITKNPKREKALRILAVKPADFDAEAIRPAIGTVRRIRALYVIGHSPKTIAAAADLDESTVSHLANGRHATVLHATENKIRRAYSKLSAVSGPSEKAKQRAAAQKWHGPLAWDDIDDPNCKPETFRKSKAKAGVRRMHADPARVAELTAAGRTAQQIADELGCHKRSVTRARRRAEQQLAA
ncbi:helix-turn-helix domain-containing protein [Streptomyces sp. NPDC085946]|uniref:helix-turn-helix domain-containing protein n=1 Tax=Streptomyces sp. NPDC085946 TaxID=3365744 RepID=UPI0037D78C80